MRTRRPQRRRRPSAVEEETPTERRQTAERSRPGWRSGCKGQGKALSRIGHKRRCEVSVRGETATRTVLLGRPSGSPPDPERPAHGPQ